MSGEPMRVEEMLRALAREDVRPRPAFVVRLTEQLIAAMAPRRLAWWRPALAGAALLLTLALIGWALTPRVPQWATLTVARGEARVSWQRPLYFRWSRSGVTVVPGGREFLLAAGDRVALSEDGDGTLILPDDGRFHLAGGTGLTLEEMDPAGGVIRIAVEAGEVVAAVPPRPGRILEVRTPAATVGVRGTVFRTRVVAADHTFSATDEGVTRVTLLDPAQGYPSVEVPAGYEVDAVIGRPLEVRPQAPAIDHLTLDGVTVEPEGTLIANRAGLDIVGRTNVPGGSVRLQLGDTLVDRAPVAPDGGFVLHFRAPAEGEYALCVAAEAPDGTRSPCVFLTYRYDATPPAVLRLLEPATPEVSGETATIRGETEPGATVRLNGEAVPVDAAGLFTARRALRPGENPITIEACDRAGNCTRLEFVLIRR